MTLLELVVSETAASAYALGENVVLSDWLLLVKLDEAYSRVIVIVVVAIVVVEVLVKVLFEIASVTPAKSTASATSARNDVVPCMFRDDGMVARIRTCFRDSILKRT